MNDLIFALKISAIGLSVVFIGLILISWFVGLLRFLDHPKTFLASNQPVESEKAEEIAHLSPKLIAAISAAVAVTIDKKFQIKRIRYRTGPQQMSWSKQGISTIMGSHVTKSAYGPSSH